ncbi:unnamed protein product [Phytomonas sp. EM1]|nr:unnamed protein product [Phytomonas sp. EM1]|eukprot:CCW64436.1 unnamed protein product [Phytomonas sp. isolate EM1]
MGRPATEALRCVAGFFKHAIPRNPGQRVFVSDLRWALAIGAELTAGEYLRRRLTRAAPLPLIVSACPGWVCYCEKQGGALLSRLSPFLSPQGIAGSLVKRGLDATCYHVSIQPCFDRKLEAARDGGFWTNGTKETVAPEEEGKENEKGEGEEAGGEKVPYTDCVLSTAELLEWMREVDETLPWRAPLDSEVDPALEGGRNPTNETLARVEGSGGYLHQAMLKAWRHAVAEAEKDTGDPAGSPSTPVFEYETKRNRNHQLVRCAALPEEVFCVAYGFQQIQNIVRGLKKNLPAVRSYTFIEMMACPDGCLNGGGQIRRSPHTPQNHEATLRAVEGVFEEFLMNPEHVSGSCLENGEGGEANCGDFKEEESHSGNLAKKDSTEAPKWDHATSSCQQNGIHAPASTGEGEGAAPAEKPLFSQKFAREILERVGLDAVRCVFVDRQKDFEEMLNKGNIQSLKW